jgi:hypothetical protein
VLMPARGKKFSRTGIPPPKTQHFLAGRRFRMKIILWRMGSAKNRSILKTTRLMGPTGKARTPIGGCRFLSISALQTPTGGGLGPKGPTRGTRGSPNFATFSVSRNQVETFFATQMPVLNVRPVG